MPTHRRTCRWNRTWHACLLLLHLLPLGVDRVLLMSLSGTPPLVCFCRTSYVSGSTLTWSISNPKSVLSPNSSLVMQVENCINFLSPLEQIATNSGLHTTQMDFLTDLEVRNPIPSTWAPVKVWAGLAPSGASEGESTPCLSAPAAAYTPWLTASSSSSNHSGLVLVTTSTAPIVLLASLL